MHTVRHSWVLQLKGMTQFATADVCCSCLHSVAACLDDRFAAILDLVRRGKVNPFGQVIVSENETPPAKQSRTLRVGINPVAANPLHWGHQVSVAFIGREGVAASGAVPTSLDVAILPPVPLSFSSTAAREALCREDFCEALVSLLYSCFLEIRTGGFYSGGGWCVDTTDH